MKIIITGGTFFKDYDVDTGMMEINDNQFHDCIKDMMLNQIPHCHLWDLKDSLKMKEEDRESLYKFCKKNIGPAQRLLVIHGTDTMAETHKYFCSRPNIGTIVFTGAFYPLSMRNTDAEFNLGFGIACTKTLPRGNYVAMNGEIFKSNVSKDHKNLKFKGNRI